MHLQGVSTMHLQGERNVGCQGCAGCGIIRAFHSACSPVAQKTKCASAMHQCVTLRSASARRPGRGARLFPPTPSSQLCFFNSSIPLKLNPRQSRGIADWQIEDCWDPTTYSRFRQPIQHSILLAQQQDRGPRTIERASTVPASVVASPEVGDS